MSLRILLQSFYADVHKCVSGKKRDREETAWEIINLAIESTQDGGTSFTLEIDEDSTAVVDTKELERVLENYNMNYVDVEKANESTTKQA